MKGKSIGAVAAGIVFVVVVTTLVDILLHAVHVFPPMNQPMDDKLSALAMRHAIWGGCFGIALGLVGVVTTWNAGLGPHWYPIALAVLALPQAWLGGKLYEKTWRA